MAELSKQLVDAMKQADERKTSAFDSIGTVRRVKDGIAYVHLAGGVDETPVQLTVDAKTGDEVQVRVSGGRAWIVGNATAPPTDNTMAKQAINYGKIANDAAQRAIKDALVANEAAQSASESAREAKETTDEINEYAETAGKTITQILNDGETAGTAAQQAKTAADNAMLSLSNVQDVVGVLDWITNHGTMESQAGETFDANNVYFVVDQNGDYVVGGTRYSLVTNPVAADIDSYYCLSVDRSIQNYVATHIVVDSEGLWIIPDSGGNKVLIAIGGAGKTYETAGTYMIGKDSNEDDVILASFSLDGTHVQSVTGEPIAHLGYGQAYDDEGALQNQPFFTLGRRNNGGVGGYSFAFGVDVVASGFCSHAEGNLSYAQGMYSYAHGKFGIFRESQGAVRATQATGESSHAEGSGVIASGMASHAEGEGCEATASGSHAEGSFSVASGMASHAEGEWCDATGMYSHAQNKNTVAGHDSQTVIGKYNDNQQNNAFEIGNGTEINNRSNAFEVDWSGNVNASGDIEDGQGNVLSEKLDSSGIFDLIYPIGSYYWTSDGNFVPDDVFGGTWEKIDAGVTLVSAGTGYTVTQGTAKDGGSKDLIVPYHKHSVAEQSTGNMSANSSHSHTVGYTNYKRASTTAATTAVSYAETTANKTTSSESVQHTHNVPSHNTNYVGTSGNTTGANMPPYKCAYCWHRTA